MLKDEDIRRWETKTSKGHTISVFFNAKSNIFVADLVHKNESGGWEFCRVTIDEETWLAHCLKWKRKEVKKNAGA